MKDLTFQQNKKQAYKLLEWKLKEVKKDWEDLPDVLEKDPYTVSCIQFLRAKSEYKNYEDYLEENLPKLKNCYTRCICNAYTKTLYYSTYYLVGDATDQESDEVIGVSPEKHSSWFCIRHRGYGLTRVEAKKKYLKRFPK